MFVLKLDFGDRIKNKIKDIFVKKNVIFDFSKEWRLVFLNMWLFCNFN